MRPHEIDLLRQPDHSGALAATVNLIRPLGPIYRLELTRERFQQTPWQVGSQHIIRTAAA